jgi:hypothetical protein
MYKCLSKLASHLRVTISGMWSQYRLSICDSVRLLSPIDHTMSAPSMSVPVHAARAYLTPMLKSCTSIGVNTFLYIVTSVCSLIPSKCM